MGKPIWVICDKRNADKLIRVLARSPECYDLLSCPHQQDDRTQDNCAECWRNKWIDFEITDEEGDGNE